MTVRTTSCVACGAALDPRPAFEHPCVPVLLNTLVHDAPTARAVPMGRLELHACRTCGLVVNGAFDGVPYDPTYVLDATLSARYRAHLDDVADRVLAIGEPPLDVVEIGAGQGTFLRHLVERLGDAVAHVHGFDPAHRGDAGAGAPTVTPSVLDATSVRALGFDPTVVVCRHVVEHVEQPVDFLSSFRTYLPGAHRLLVETPNVAHTLSRGLLHDFCYEHCTMFTAAALDAALRRAGYADVVVDTAFGGEYLVATARAGTTDGPMRVLPDATTHERLLEVSTRFVTEHVARIERARRLGPVACWGAAGKGALFAHLVDPDRTRLEVVVDIHPAKHGSFLPGAGHEVVSPEEAVRRGVRTVFVANPTYLAEVEATCRALAPGLRVEAVGWAHDA